MGSQRAFRHSETQLVSKNVTGFTPLRDYAATYVAPDRAFPNYESESTLAYFDFECAICVIDTGLKGSCLQLRLLWMS